MRHERHHWLVNVLDDDTAAIQVDGREVTSIPRWLLPEGVREGDVVVVDHDRSTDRSTLVIEPDPTTRRHVYEHPEGGLG
ncbi:MAG TPA: DUF3006 domain-containing protein [Gemmatimonadaceae bacterium]|jgi:hypothetical protein|nr:DUF3006 domain-containing protein [Gemmatimonadaceae bacterium]